MREHREMLGVRETETDDLLPGDLRADVAVIGKGMARIGGAFVGVNLRGAVENRVDLFVIRGADTTSISLPCLSSARQKAKQAAGTTATGPHASITDRRDVNEVPDAMAFTS